VTGLDFLFVETILKRLDNDLVKKKFGLDLDEIIDGNISAEDKCFFPLCAFACWQCPLPLIPPDEVFQCRHSNHVLHSLIDDVKSFVVFRDIMQRRFENKKATEFEVDGKKSKK